MAKSNTVRIGAHMSTSKGLEKVPGDSKKIGGNAFQIFPHSPSMWKAQIPDVKKQESFKRELLASGIGKEDVLVHSGYLINLASPKEEVWTKSVGLLSLEMKIVATLGLKYLNFHPGSHLGTGFEAGLSRIVRGLELVLKENQDNGVVLLLENVAPKGGNIGSKFDELGKIIESSVQPERIMITYDTCHGFDSGYDITSPEAVEKLLEEIESSVGLEKLAMIHLNDSKFPLGSAKDRHERIGMGFIGKNGFKPFLNNAEIMKIPWLLETPGNDIEHGEDITIVKEIIGIDERRS